MPRLTLVREGFTTETRRARRGEEDERKEPQMNAEARRWELKEEEEKKQTFLFIRVYRRHPRLLPSGFRLVSPVLSVPSVSPW